MRRNNINYLTKQCDFARKETLLSEGRNRNYMRGADTDGTIGGNQAYGGVVGMQGRIRVKGQGKGAWNRGGVRARTERSGSGADLTGRRGGNSRRTVVEVNTVTKLTATSCGTDVT